ncbi:MAG: MucR family transcriptional regulator [Hyphomicrobium sp.]|nr:MucR family transcriptional regulator [Hyphomicrobium sp.]
MPATSPDELLAITSHVVRAFLERNSLPAHELSSLISGTYGSLAGLGAAPLRVPLPEEPVGAVSPRKSLASPDHIISMIDGKPYRMLKKHLGRHGLTPDEYRARYKLQADYPMVAPAYAAERSEMAKRSGLGRKPPRDAAPSRRTLKIAGPKAD